MGATGATGIEIVKRATQRGHSVRAFVRSAQRLAGLPSAVDIIEGDLLNADELKEAASGYEAVLSAFGPREPRSKVPLVGPFARALTRAMAQKEPSRLIILSVAFLFRDSVLPPAYPLGQVLFKHLVADCADMEAIVQRSRLEWTIVRPPQLTNKPRSGKYRVRVQHLPFMGFTVSRADVADFMIQAMEQGSYTRQIVGLAN
ncbi:MAG TPA: NAD(P)-binding oxidoreductase [Candidatus Cybelea sp.]